MTSYLPVLSAHAPRAWRAATVIPFAFPLALLLMFVCGPAVAKAEDEDRFVGPTASQTLAVSADDRFLAVANPDNNSVTLFDVRRDRNRRIAEIPVGREPNGVAFHPDGEKLYVANTVSGTVSVLTEDNLEGHRRQTRTIRVGTEPYD